MRTEIIYMVTLKNSNLEVKINELGAEVKSIYGFDTEYIWEGKKEIWGNSCPLLFPICGGLKEDKYTVYGEEYSLSKHRLLCIALYHKSPFLP